MKALALITYTVQECYGRWASLASLGHEVIVHQYDQYPAGQHGPLVDKVREVSPDFVLYIGAPAPYHARPVPAPDILAAINKISPTVHICGDGGDPPWWPILEEYDRERCFTVQVNIDGSPSPVSSFRNGLLRLAPMDPRPFKPLPWNERKHLAMLMGGMGGGERGEITTALVQKQLLQWYPGPGRPYDDLAAIMCSYKIGFNHPMTGSGTKMHVKGRLVEVGYAGCVLLERYGSPAQNWFFPGIEYLTYNTAGDAARLIEVTPDALLQQMAHEFHEHVMKEHSPAAFWGKVFDKMKECA